MIEIRNIVVTCALGEPSVVVMSPRPGTVRDIVRIDLKRPCALDVRDSHR